MSPPVGSLPDGRALRGGRGRAAIALFLRRLADRLDPPAADEEAFRDKLRQEAIDNLFPAPAGMNEALNRVYRERPTAYTRKLEGIDGGRR